MNKSLASYYIGTGMWYVHTQAAAYSEACIIADLSFESMHTSHIQCINVDDYQQDAVFTDPFTAGRFAEQASDLAIITVFYIQSMAW